VAQAGGGICEFVSGSSNLQEKVLRQLNRALQPAVVNLSVIWGTGKNSFTVRQTPYKLRPIFDGERSIVYGFIDNFSKEAVVSNTIELIGTSPKGKFKTTVSIDWSSITSGTLIRTLAAREMIRDLEQNISYLHENEELKKNINELAKSVKNEIIYLACNYGLASKYTSFIAVEERDAPTIGSMQKRNVTKKKELKEEHLVMKLQKLEIYLEKTRS